MEINFRNKRWMWNDVDEKLLQVNVQIDDFSKALALIPSNRRRCAIQAGGAMGVWPYEISNHFQKVFTFEPNVDNFECLVRNIADKSNIIATNAGLSDTRGFCTTKLHDSEINNAGAYYTLPASKGVPQLILDEIITESVDFIQLDVEGRELQVLRGAKNVIKDSYPVIMVEEKPLPQDVEIGHIVGETEAYLLSLGYKVVHRVHRDIIFKHK